MAKLICERCGAEIDPAIGNCSLCDGNVKQEAPEPVEVKSSKKSKKSK